MTDYNGLLVVGEGLCMNHVDQDEASHVIELSQAENFADGKLAIAINHF